MGLNSSSGANAGLAKTVLLISQPREVEQNVVQWDKYKSECIITMEGMGLSTKTKTHHQKQKKGKYLT